jgi:hypothetical protein
MPNGFKDKALEAFKNDNSGHNNTFNDVDDTKEWEGVYPTVLD